MIVRVARWLVVVALALSLGAHWAVLQSIAWAGMVVSYSRDGTIGEALNKTFNGKNPCTICKMVQEGKKAEGKTNVVKVDADQKFVLQTGTVLPCPPSDYILLATGSDAPSTRTTAPPLPPPRFNGCLPV